ncbi:TetR family transcriptional regulator [Paenibacillus sp. IB182496]|uniref:TetR family transcriptional regulator n=1 Tax=Paenibacillus sabuli TaxID=2772509 RepID=A0A927GQ77_9BACL|nr:TetR family transcriptional regulator [Paenibacillus sabuli]MBD2843991.1 TetR family transcriptional regulator [Paenibacillus sabuli]
MAGRRSMDKADKREVQTRILDAAEAQFAGNSYAGARVNEIAAQAGVNQALIHYYFQSKEGLYEAVLTRLFAQWERAIGGIAWDEIEPEELIRRYVETHYRIRCAMPNLFHIITWGALEGGELLGRYAPPSWATHFETVRQALRRWQAQGAILQDMNVPVFLHTLWGMMEHFYYRSEGYLQDMAGHEGSASAIQQEIAAQIVRQSLHGVLPQPQLSARAATAGMERLLVVRAHDAGPEAIREADAVLDAVLHSTGRTAVGLDQMEPYGTTGDAETGDADTAAGGGAPAQRRSGDDATRQRKSDAAAGRSEAIASRRSEALAARGDDVAARQEEERIALEEGAPLLVLASTVHGELPMQVVALLDRLSRDEDVEASRCVGIWTLGTSPAGDSAQRAMEEAFNRMGAYAAARVPGQTLQLYARRFARLLAGFR